jgi:hypothetical protein
VYERGGDDGGVAREPNEHGYERDRTVGGCPCKDDRSGLEQVVAKVWVTQRRCVIVRTHNVSPTSTNAMPIAISAEIGQRGSCARRNGHRGEAAQTDEDLGGLRCRSVTAGRDETRRRGSGRRQRASSWASIAPTMRYFASRRLRIREHDCWRSAVRNRILLDDFPPGSRRTVRVAPPVLSNVVQ